MKIEVDIKRELPKVAGSALTFSSRGGPIMPSLDPRNATIKTNFDLKNTAVDLVPTGTIAKRVRISIDDLENMRTSGRAVPASKHGLELICGASCDTGAQ
jgi:hypothetical protein